MNNWNALKQEFNEKQEIAISEIYKKYANGIRAETMMRYVGLLEGCELIEFRPKVENNLHTTVHCYRALRKIPEKLTITEATTMQYMPWLLWFKYPENEL